MSRPTLIVAALAAGALLPAASALGASLDVNPVRIDLVGRGQAAELRLTNTGGEALALQVDALKWEQDVSGVDRLVATDELLAVPPLFTLAPGERQIVRIGYLGTASPAREQSFRLLVTELAVPEASAAQGSQLAMRMRLSIPAFVAPSAATARAELALRDVDASTGSSLLTVENVGNAHARLARIEVLGVDGWQTLPEAMTVRYLLPGATTTIPIAAAIEALSAVRIASIDGRDWEYALRSPE
jgi:fimbrial chaperone protein